MSACAPNALDVRVHAIELKATGLLPMKKVRSNADELRYSDNSTAFSLV